MTYYHLPTDTERHPSRNGEHKLSDGSLLRPPETSWTDDLAAACGFTVVVDTPRPADTDTTTHDRGLSRDGDTVTETWTERAKTQAELDAEALAERQAQRETTIEQAVATLRQWASDADATTVTNGNNTQVTQVLVDRLGVFFSRFATLVEHQYGEQS